MIGLGTAALIGGGLSLLGGAVGTGVNMHENKKNREFSAAEALLQRKWQTEMDNTKYQRAVEDMEKAGINPAMVFGGGAGGGGISTPNGAAAHATGNSSTVMNMNTINSAANLAAAFNYDKNKSNDVNLHQITKASSKLNKEFFSDLDKVKI